MRALFCCLCLLLAAGSPARGQLLQGASKPVGGMPQVGPLPDFNFLGSTGAVGRSTRLMNASNLLETLAAQTNWASHAGSGGGGGVFTTPTNGILMTTNGNVVTVGANLGATAPITLSTNSGKIIIGAAGVGSGTVTSVGLATPGGLSALGSPVTAAGIISILADATPGFWQNNGSGVTSWSWDGSSLININGSQITFGTIPDARLNIDVTRMGNFFNNASQLLQLNSSDQYPALDGSLILSLNASALAGGTIPAARMPAFSGDITTPAGSTATTLKNTGTAGTYIKTTFDGQGREISGTTLAPSDLPPFTNILSWYSIQATNPITGDYFFWDPTNHASGSYHTNGGFVAETNGVLYIGGTTNTDTVINFNATGWTSLGGAETNSTIHTASGLGFLAIDPNGARSPATFDSHLAIAGGVLSGAYIPLNSGIGTNTMVYGDANKTNAIIIQPGGLVESNNLGTVTLGGGYIALTGVAAQPGQWTMFNGNTNATFFFDGTNLYTSGFTITNSGGLSIQTALNNTTNEVTRQAIALGNSLTNGAVNQLTNFANAISQNLTNIAATMTYGNTGNQAVPAGTVAFYALNGNGITNLMTSDISTFTRSLMSSKVKIGPLRVLVSGNPGAFADKIEVFTNGVLCSITVAVNNVTSGVDSTHTETVLGGTEVGYKITSAASSTPEKWSMALEERIVP